MNTNDKIKIGHVDERGLIWNGFEYMTPARYELWAAAATTDSVPTVLVPQVDRLQNRATIFEALLGSTQGEDYKREGLQETPMRAAKAWDEWMCGYTMNAADLLKVFEDGAAGCDEMVVVQNIPVYSHCEHHLAPIFGTATVGYLPNDRIVGLSKLNRLVDMFARRLQVQERLTVQIADALMQNLNPKGVGVLVRARHMCMESRGIKHAGTHTTTSSMQGLFRTDPQVRQEFLNLASK